MAFKKIKKFGRKARKKLEVAKTKIEKKQQEREAKEEVKLDKELKKLEKEEKRAELRIKKMERRERARVKIKRARTMRREERLRPVRQISEKLKSTQKAYRERGARIAKQPLPPMLGGPSRGPDLLGLSKSRPKKKRKSKTPGFRL